MRTIRLTMTLAAGLMAAGLMATARAAPNGDAIAAGAPPSACGGPQGCTRLGGTLFANAVHFEQADRGHAVRESDERFNVRRLYLSVDHRFSAVWSANLTTDATYASAGGRARAFVKKAYVEGAFAPLANLRVGAAGMPWIPFVESWYGYRFVEGTLVDRAGFGNSTDWGLHLSGAGGRVDYQASVATGGGYRKPSHVGRADLAARAAWLPVPGLVLAAGGYAGDLGGEAMLTPHRVRRRDLMMAWRRAGLRLGGEWFSARNWKRLGSGRSDAASGWSLWASRDFAQASVFARYDRVRPSTELAAAEVGTYWNAGIAFPLAPWARLAVAHKVRQARHGGSLADGWTRETGAWLEAKW